MRLASVAFWAGLTTIVACSGDEFTAVPTGAAGTAGTGAGGDRGATTSAGAGGDGGATKSAGAGGDGGASAGGVSGVGGVGGEQTGGTSAGGTAAAGSGGVASTGGSDAGGADQGGASSGIGGGGQSAGGAAGANAGTAGNSGAAGGAGAAGIAGAAGGAGAGGAAGSGLAGAGGVAGAGGACLKPSGCGDRLLQTGETCDITACEDTWCGANCKWTQAAIGLGASEICRNGICWMILAESVAQRSVALNACEALQVDGRNWTLAYWLDEGELKTLKEVASYRSAVAERRAMWLNPFFGQTSGWVQTEADKPNPAPPPGGTFTRGLRIIEGLDGVLRLVPTQHDQALEVNRGWVLCREII